MRATRGLSIVKAMDEGTNIVTMKLLFQSEPEKLETIMYLSLDFARALMNIPDSPMMQEILLQLAVEVLEDENNRMFTFEELIYGFKKGASGKYGPNYNTLSAETVNRWLDGLYAEHMQRIETRHLDRKASIGDSDPMRLTSEPKLLQDVFQKTVKQKHQQLPAMSSSNQDQYAKIHESILNSENEQNHLNRI